MQLHCLNIFRKFPTPLGVCVCLFATASDGIWSNSARQKCASSIPLNAIHKMCFFIYTWLRLTPRCITLLNHFLHNQHKRHQIESVNIVSRHTPIIPNRTQFWTTYWMFFNCIYFWFVYCLLFLSLLLQINWYECFGVVVDCCIKTEKKGSLNRMQLVFSQNTHTDHMCMNYHLKKSVKWKIYALIVCNLKVIQTKYVFLSFIMLALVRPDMRFVNRKRWKCGITIAYKNIFYFIYVYMLCGAVLVCNKVGI